jgi:hypothetical protein
MNFNRNRPAYEKLRIGKAGCPFVIHKAMLRLDEGHWNWSEGKYSYDLHPESIHKSLALMKNSIQEIKISWGDNMDSSVRSVLMVYEENGEDPIDISEFIGSYVEYQGILYPIATGVQSIETAITIQKS